MTIGQQIMTDIESLLISHPAFVTTLSVLQERIESTFAGHRPCITLMTGPSRCGKTEVLEELVRTYPAKKIDGRREIPVLKVYIKQGSSPKSLPLSVISALGIPQPTAATSVARLEQMMLDQLALAKVRMILFDEASHLVEIGARIPPRAAADWFKDLYTNAKEIGLILAGLPRLTRLLENEQFAYRARHPVSLMPYQWDVTDERNAFASCVKAYLEIFNKRGCQFDHSFNFNKFTRDCYATSAGHVGLLANFFMALAENIIVPTPLTISRCFQATTTLNLPGHGALRGFTENNLTDEDLLQTLVIALDRNDLVISTGSVRSELANAKVQAFRRSLN